MRFLFIQIIIVILVCIFIAALSNLTEMGLVGWIIIGSTGHALYKIYKHMHYRLKSTSTKEKCPFCNPFESNISKTLQSLMFDDATGIRDD